MAHRLHRAEGHLLGMVQRAGAGQQAGRQRQRLQPVRLLLCARRAHQRRLAGHTLPRERPDLQDVTPCRVAARFNRVDWL